MENLNAEQVKRALDACIAGECIRGGCPLYIYEEPVKECTTRLAKYALALINSQEQRIGAQDMTISELRNLLEKANHDADRYARKIKELAEENERLFVENKWLKLDIAVCEAELSRYTENIVQMAKQDRADTVRKMQEMVYEFADDLNTIDAYIIKEMIDQIAKEMLEDAE